VGEREVARDNDELAVARAVLQGGEFHDAVRDEERGGAQAGLAAVPFAPT
jgi:predicted DsbA family dithiol-disulfide isomerase